MENQKILDNIVSKNTYEVPTELEEKVLGRLKTFEEAYLSHEEYYYSGHQFKLSERFSHVERLMEDIQPGEVVGIGGYSGTGKTAVTSQFIDDYLDISSTKGVFVTLEMSNRSFFLRKAMEELTPDYENKVSKQEASEKTVTKKEFREKLFAKHKNMLLLDNEYSLKNIFAIVEVFKKYLERNGDNLSVVAIDFAQLLQGGSDVSLQAAIFQMLKEEAKRLDIIVFVLHQLKSASSPTVEPTPADISGRGENYQLMDYMYFIWKKTAEGDILCMKSSKERWSPSSGIELKRRGMKFYSQAATGKSEDDIAKDNGFLGLTK